MNVNGGLRVLLSVINRGNTFEFSGLITDLKIFPKKGLFQEIWVHFVIKRVGVRLRVCCSVDLEANCWLPKRTNPNTAAI